MGSRIAQSYTPPGASLSKQASVFLSPTLALLVTRVSVPVEEQPSWKRRLQSRWSGGLVKDGKSAEPKEETESVMFNKRWELAGPSVPLRAVITEQNSQLHGRACCYYIRFLH